MTRVCIVTGAYHNPRETQINFHIENMFGGNSAVLCSARRAADPFNRPLMAWEQKEAQGQMALQRVASFVSILRSLADHRTARVPYGKTRRSIQEFLKDHDVDAVLAEFGTTSLRLAPVVSETGLPMFTYFRGADASSHLRELFRAEAYRRMMPQLSGVFSVSQFLLDVLASHGSRHPNSHVVPSGVDTALFVPAVKQKGSLIAVGRFIEKKRPDITVEAFCTAAKTAPQATLEMIGDGPLLDKCKAIAAAHDMGERVIFHGQRPHDFVRARLGASEIFVQHSVVGANGDTEGLPTAIQEAMSCGLFVVSTRHAGIPEAVVEGLTGYLVEEGDAAGFADRIAQALAIGDRMPALSGEIRKQAQDRYDNRKLIRIVEREIAAAVAARGSRS